MASVDVNRVRYVCVDYAKGSIPHASMQKAEENYPNSSLPHLQ
eukprot:Gb_30844 [translate_table: standard]